MYRSFLYSAFVLLFIGFLCQCNTPATETKATTKPKIDALQLKSITAADTGIPSPPFYYTFEPLQLNCPIPALQSFVFAQANGYWIFIGGGKKGFHGTDNNPPPFNAKVANDSIWVIDINGQHSWSVVVPSSLSTVLSATNAAYTQNGQSLYICGGYTRSDTTVPNFNSTSGTFLEINLSALIGYVQTGGTGNPLSSVITKQIQSPYVQVTGGALLQFGNYFYLVGGQNYSGTYSSGVTGNYTNAIRRFSLQQQQGVWAIGDTASLVDPVNLHRRDMNVVPGPGTNNFDAVLYGGVFTKNDLAYRNAVFIGGLASGNPTISIDSMQQAANQYTCAFASFAASSYSIVVTSFFGGISYEIYDKDSGKLVVGDHGVPMPFSNIVSTVLSDGVSASGELIQLPPGGPLLPGYIGANAAFIPVPEFEVQNKRGLLNLDKISADTTFKCHIGYLFGGIVSAGPTSGTTPKGRVPTYANPILYKVYLNFPPM